MTSSLAEIAVKEMRDEGLEPTVDDIVRLNALGLRVERGETMTDFAAVPRHAFLGDHILSEPTLAVRIWLDEAASVLKNDYFTRLCLTAYALNTPADRLPELTNARKIRQAVTDFRDKVLLVFTETEIAAAVDYALRGGAPEDDVFAEPSESELEAVRKVRETPAELRSHARGLLAKAVRGGIDMKFALTATERALEGLIVEAAIARGGAEVIRAMKDDATGEFYRTADRIAERLRNLKKEEKTNG